MKWFVSALLFIGHSAIQAQRADTLPPPNATKSHLHFAKVVGWGKDEKPIAPPGFTVSLYAEGFDNPRWLCQTPNGDVLVAESNGHHTLVERIGAPFIGAARFENLHK